MRSDAKLRMMLAAACILLAGCVHAQSGTWNVEGPLPEVVLVSGTAVVDGKLYVLGGSTGSAPSDRNWVYDPSTGSWDTSLAPVPVAHSAPVAAAVGGRIYVISGEAPGGVQTTRVDVYDPASDSWSLGDPIPNPVLQAGVAVVDDIIYVIGGWRHGCNRCNEVQAYDPATGLWSIETPMPTPRSQMCVAAIDGIIYVIGGSAGGNLGMTEAYDPGTDTWTTAHAPMPTPRSDPHCGILGDKIVTVSGNSPTAAPDDAVEVYDPMADSWSPETPIPTPRSNHMVSVVGQVLHALGGGGEGVGRSHETFRPGGIEVAFDVRPQGCPNPLNGRARGLLPAAIVGTADVDVTDIDAASIRLEGVESRRSDIENVASPYDPRTGKEAASDCTDAGPDAFDDLTLKFPNQAVVDALEARLGRELVDGEVLTVELTGRLLDGTDFLGEDVVVIIDH